MILIILGIIIIIIIIIITLTSTVLITKLAVLCRDVTFSYVLLFRTLNIFVIFICFYLIPFLLQTLKSSSIKVMMKVAVNYVVVIINIIIIISSSSIFTWHPWPAMFENHFTVVQWTLLLCIMFYVQKRVSRGEGTGC